MPKILPSAALAALVLTASSAAAQTTTYRVFDSAPGSICPGGTVASPASQFPEFAAFDLNGDGTVCTQIVQAPPSVTPPDNGFRGGLGGSGTAVAGALIGLVVVGALGASGGS